jgi:hypothetical protein
MFVPTAPFRIEALPRPQYAYLRGLYLGDGWLAAMARGTFSLRISLDQRYPGIIAAAQGAIAAVNPNSVVRAWPRIGCYVVSSY